MGPDVEFIYAKLEYHYEDIVREDTQNEVEDGKKEREYKRQLRNALVA